MGERPSIASTFSNNLSPNKNLSVRINFLRSSLHPWIFLFFTCPIVWQSKNFMQLRLVVDALGTRATCRYRQMFPQGEVITVGSGGNP